jgi:flavin reductase (DIM6/NTAB) family NADH-FMN oxidoreductase RutF
MNIECKVTKRIEYGTHVIYLGEVLQVHVEESLLKNGKIDPLKQDQIVYTSQNYYGLIKEPFERQAFSVNKK